MSFVPLRTAVYVVVVLCLTASTLLAYWFYLDERTLWSPDVRSARTSNLRTLARSGRGRASVRGADDDRLLPYRVVIVGLAHNNRAALSHTRPLLEATAGLFRQARVVIYENDSTDGTDAYLKRWARQDPRVHVVSERLGRASAAATGLRSVSRFARLAFYRNKYLKVVREAYSDWDLLLVVDTDVAWWSVDALRRLLTEHPPECEDERPEDDVRTDPPRLDAWDVVCGQGVTHHGFYYDSLAHRDLLQRWHVGQGEAYHKRRRVLGVRARVAAHDARLRAVQSCFGGLALYRLKHLLSNDCAYDGTYDCEHINFHACAGRVRMYPPWLVVHADR